MKPYLLATQWVFRLALSLLFAMAAFYKAVDIVEHAQHLSMAVQIVDPATARLVLAGVAGIETALAIGLVLVPGSRWPLIGTVILLAIFSAYLVYLLTLNETPSCRCLPIFRSENETIQAVLGLVRNCGFAGMAIWLLATPGDHNSIVRVDRMSREISS